MDDVATNQLRGFIERTGSPAPGPTFLNPSNIPLSTVCYDNTPVTGGLWILAKVAGAPTWVPLGPPAGSASWPKYVASSNPDVPAPYATISAAYAAAVAAGHDNNSPATILVHPGAYAAPAVYNTPGIGIEAFSCSGTTNNQSGVVITSLLSIVLTAPGAVRLSGISFTAGINVSGANATQLTLDNCTVQAPGVGIALAWSAAAGGFLELIDSLVSSAGGVSFSSSSVILDMVARDTVFQSPSTGVAMGLADGSQRFYDCEIFGSVQITDSGSPGSPRHFNQCRLKTTGSVNPAVGLFGGNAQAVFIGGVIDCANLTAAFGIGAATGSITLVGTQMPGPRGASSVLGVALLATEAVYQRPWNVVADTNAALPVEARGVLTAAVSATTTILGLPDLLQFPDGEAIEIKRTAASANTVTASAMGGQSVDGAASVTLTELTARGSITVRADRSGLNWRVVAVVGTFV